GRGLEGGRRGARPYPATGGHQPDARFPDHRHGHARTLAGLSGEGRRARRRGLPASPCPRALPCAPAMQQSPGLSAAIHPHPEMTRMKTTRLAAALSIATATLATLAAGPAAAETVRWAAAGDALTMDPHAQNEGPTHVMNHQVYDSLVFRDQAMKLAP